MNTSPLLETFQSDLEARAAARQQKIDRVRDRNLRTANADKVKAAIADPLEWLQSYTKTYNEHWVEEKRPDPYEPFPKKDYFRPLFDLFLSEPIVIIEKSRDMMASWACVGYFTWEAMRVSERGIVFQAQKEKKVVQLVDYAKCLYDNQPGWIKDAFPLAKSIDKQPDLELHFAHGGNIMGIPGGKDQIRSYHPWGYFSDETAFQPEAGECYDHALAAAQKIILNSSAGPGWLADFKRDIHGYNGED